MLDDVGGFLGIVFWSNRFYVLWWLYGLLGMLWLVWLVKWNLVFYRRVVCFDVLVL